MPPPMETNRYATGIEADSVTACMTIERENVKLAARRLDHAEKAVHEARERLRVSEAAYLLDKTLVERATSYFKSSRQEFSHAEERLAIVSAPLHPIRKVSLEILGQIFQHCFTSCVNVLSRDALFARQLQPFHLAAVCKQWRTVSLSCSRVWAFLEIDLDNVEKDRNSTRVWRRYVSDILMRSNEVGLRLYIRRRCSRPHNNILGPVVSHAARCVELFAHISGTLDTDDCILQILCATNQRLRFAHLRMPNMDASVAPVSLLLPHSPPLNVATVCFPFFGKLDLSMTKEVVLKSPVCERSGDDFMTYLSWTPTRAKRLTIDSPIMVEAPTMLVTLLAVDSLVVIHRALSGQTVPLYHLATAISMPKLLSLELLGTVETAEERIEYLSELKVGSLKSLSIKALDADSMATFLELLPNFLELTYMRIISTNFDCDMFFQFCEALEWGDFENVPKLRTLVLTSQCTLSQGCDPHLLARMTESRKNAATEEENDLRPVQLMEVKFLCCKDTSVLERLSNAVLSP